MDKESYERYVKRLKRLSKGDFNIDDTYAATSVVNQAFAEGYDGSDIESGDDKMMIAFKAAKYLRTPKFKKEGYGRESYKK